MPVTMRFAFAAQSASYVAWFGIFMYSTEWVGTTIFNGDDGASQEQQLLFTQGVRHANISLAWAALLCSAASISIPLLLKRVSLVC